MVILVNYWKMTVLAYRKVWIFILSHYCFGQECLLAPYKNIVDSLQTCKQNGFLVWFFWSSFPLMCFMVMYLCSLDWKKFLPLPFFCFCIFLKSDIIVQVNASWYPLEFLNFLLTVSHSCLLNVNRLIFLTWREWYAYIFLDCFVDSVILKLEWMKGLLRALLNGESRIWNTVYVFLAHVLFRVNLISSPVETKRCQIWVLKMS